jgi:hypothetical protein
MWSCGHSPLLPLDSGLVQQIRRLRTLKMRASGLVFIWVSLAQQQVDFDRPKVRAIVRASCQHGLHQDHGWRLSIVARFALVDRCCAGQLALHMASTMWSCGRSPLLPLDLGLVQQIRCLRTLKMRMSGLIFIRVGLQQVDFDRPKVRAIVRASRQHVSISGPLRLAIVVVQATWPCTWLRPCGVVAAHPCFPWTRGWSSKSAAFAPSRCAERPRFHPGGPHPATGRFRPPKSPHCACNHSHSSCGVLVPYKMTYISPYHYSKL